MKEHTEKSQRKKLSLSSIATRALICVLSLLVIAVVALNIYVRITYAAFYKDARFEFDIPGLSIGFVPQDLDYLDSARSWLFSGYIPGVNSPLFKVDDNGQVSEIFPQMPDGSPYKGHGSGVTSNSQYVFLTFDKGYLVFRASDIEHAKDGESVTAIGEVELDIAPAFLNIENGQLYTGNFYYPGDYETPDHHRIIAPNGIENRAIMLVYCPDASQLFGFELQASFAYSIPSMVQGVCTTPAGEMVLSTSYGARSSRLLVYDMGLVTQSGTFTADGRAIPLYILDSSSLTRTIEAPPMSEGIESHDERVFISEESASNKYIFGKLYGAGKVYSLAV